MWELINTKLYRKVYIVCTPYIIDMDAKRTRHSRYQIFYHLVWLSKKENVLYGERAKRMESILHEIADGKKIEIAGMEVMPDHIHLFVSSPPQYSPSLLVNWFKGISARMYNYRYNDAKIKWTNAYYVGTAGTVSKETIQKYIERQTKK